MSARSPAPPSTRRILLIDDSPVVIGLISRELDQLGYAVTAAQGGAEGLEVFTNDRLEHGRPFDVVVTDLNMPEVDGAEVVRQIVATGTETPVIVLSSASEMESVRLVMRAGAFDFVVKDEGLEPLNQAIERALDRVSEFRERYQPTTDPKVMLEGLAAEGATGELVASDDRVEVHVFLQAGKVAWATSSLLEYPFTRYLIEQHGVTQEQIRLVLRACRGQARGVADALVRAEVASEEQVRSALRAQISAATAALVTMEGARALFMSRDVQSNSAVLFELEDIKLW